MGVAVITVVEQPAPSRQFEAVEPRVVAWQPQTIYVPPMPLAEPTPEPVAEVAEPTEPIVPVDAPRVEDRRDTADEPVERAEEPVAHEEIVEPAAEPVLVASATPTLPVEAIGRSDDLAMPVAAASPRSDSPVGTTPSEPAAPATTNGAVGDNADADHAAALRAYAGQIRELAAHTLEYPLRARRLGLEGRVVLAIRVDRRGRIVEITVRESSGHEILDDAAIAAARAIDLPAPPDGFDYNNAAIELPYLFRVES